MHITNISTQTNTDAQVALNNKLSTAANLAQAGKKLTDETLKKIEDISLEIMEQTRITLMMTFRFFDSALWHMDFKPYLLDATLATNAKHIYFNSLDLAFDYKKDPNKIIRDYLHSILHCIFRQPLDDAHAHYDIWNLACDISIETIALEMAGNIFPCEKDADCQKEIDLMKESWGTLTPHKLYKELDKQLSQRNEETDKAYDYLNSLFRRDSHGFWANSPHEDKESETGERKDPIDSNRGEKKEQNEQKKSQEEQQKLDSSDQKLNANKQNEENSKDAQDQQDSDEQQNSEASSDDQSEVRTKDSNENSNTPQRHEAFEMLNPKKNDKPPAADANDEELQQEWEDISKQLETMIEEYKRTWSADFGNLTANLTIANRQECDYSKFLKQFAVMGEDMMINDDEFDYIFYTYGLQLYENMPLIEPLEYKENNAIREFVIALDTSGSCQGELIKEFVARTYEILKSSEEFGSKINLHIIQCDARVQSDYKITSSKEMEKYQEEFQVRGFGGTDFRPVFNHVDKMIEEGEFENLRGLIYFTDGMGIFPKHAPQYDTAFVFVDSDGESYHVPPWAMKVIISEDEIFELGKEQ